MAPARGSKQGRFRGLRRRALLASAALWLGACAHEAPAAPNLELLDFRPRQRLGVYLNEPLVLHFSGELDPATITSESVRIVAADSTTARGERFVTGRELTFLPDPVCARNLLDGGYLPDTTYHLELAGFPRADALRSVDGACLASTLRIEFHTISIADRAQGPIFLDYSDNQGLPLLLHTGRSASGERRITSQEGLELEGEEPLDPSTLADDVFVLQADAGGQGSRYGLRPVLEENYNKHAAPFSGTQKTTRLRLVPDRLVPPGLYKLRIDTTKPGIRDLGGNPVPVIGTAEALQKLRIRVEAGAAPQGEYLEEFLDPKDRRSGALVPGADGTAVWSGTGRVEIRFPAAAGSGADGEIAWTGAQSATRIEAVHLSVPEGATCELDGGAGLCRLSSQAALEIAGKLERSGDALAVPFPEIREQETLTEFLARMEGERTPLTVLIAGGDLRISGELAVPGPLLLVAGGRVRVSGRVSVAGLRATGPGDFASAGENGAIAVAWGLVKGAQLTQVADAGAVREFLDAEGVLQKRVVPLVLDPPVRNPLVRPLFYAVRSNPIPLNEFAEGWLPADDIIGRPGAGSYRVRFAGERRSPDGSGELLVDDPALLIDCPTLRLVIELRVPAASDDPAKPNRWDPPLLDAVRVRWKSGQ